MNKKYTSALAFTALVASALFAVPTFAAEKQQLNVTARLANPTLTLDGLDPVRKDKPMPERGMIGTVTSVNGTTFTMTVKERSKKDEAEISTTYTVDASKATFVKRGTGASISTIVVGDMVMVMGPVTGTTIAAIRIMDEFPKAGEKKEMETRKDPVFVGDGQPVVAGTVTAVSENTITITNKSNVTFTIDASTAKVDKAGVASTVANVAVGDMIIAQGTVNGSAVTASTIVDQGQMPTPKAAALREAMPEKPRGIFNRIGNFFGKMLGF
jgi:hypothetical protein